MNHVAQNNHYVLSFLKTRPQIAALGSVSFDSNASANPTTIADKSRSNAVGQVIRFSGQPGAWQFDESIDDFLKRAPVTIPTTPTYAGWLWVQSPTTPRAQLESRDACTAAAFVEKANHLLEESNIRHPKTAGGSQVKSQFNATREMAKHRDRLECQLLVLAKQMGLTTGKWMLFPSFERLSSVWKSVATATSQGRLGPTAKSAVYDQSNGDTLICVYTYDFSDTEDVRRVLEELIELGLVQSDGNPSIYYKCDAYTHLGITSKNDYKLRASLYSSKEILRNEAKALADGSIARLNKRGRKDDFPSWSSDDIS